MQGGLEGEDGAQPISDPSRDGRGLKGFLHEHGTRNVQRVSVRNAVTVAGKGRVLQAGAEKGCQEEGRRWGCAAPIQLVEALKVCVQ